MFRFLVAVGCPAVLFGCGGGGGSGSEGDPGPAPEVLLTLESFSEDFSGAFPGSTWRIKEGAPAVDPNRGNPTPGLVMNGPAAESRVRSGFNFSTAGPLSVAVEVATPDLAAGETGRFKFELEDGSEETEAEFEIRLDTWVIEFEIRGVVTEIPFPGDTDFHAFAFDVDPDGSATWSMDGEVIAKVPGFPAFLARLDLRTETATTAIFVVDNVSVLPSDGGGGSGPGGDEGGGGPQDEFLEDFSGGFPLDDWVIEHGAVDVDPDLGNPGAALSIGPSTDLIRMISAFTFSTADPLALSFDLATPDLPTGFRGRFEFELKRDRQESGEASFELRLEDGRMRFKILGSETEVAFTPDLAFHSIAFAVDEDGVASWSIDGSKVASLSGFPQGLFRIRMETQDGDKAGFVVDNVALTR